MAFSANFSSGFCYSTSLVVVVCQHTYGFCVVVVFFVHSCGVEKLWSGKGRTDGATANKLFMENAVRVIINKVELKKQLEL